MEPFRHTRHTVIRNTNHSDLRLAQAGVSTGVIYIFFPPFNPTETESSFQNALIFWFYNLDDV